MKIFLTVLLAGIFAMNIAFAEIDKNEDFNYLVLVNKTERLPEDYESKVNLITVMKC